MKYFSLPFLFLLISCGQTNTNSDNIVSADTDSSYNAIEAESTTGESVKFLWRGNKYDQELKDSFNSIIIDEEFCKSMTDPERAALGYIATFIGNECGWDGEYTEDRSNLKCKILSALNLGYQCSDKHLGFLRKMFKNDPKVLEELKSDNCPTTPDGATSQEIFDEITLTVNNTEILVDYAVSGSNLRESLGWSYTITDQFQIENDHIKLIKRTKSKVVKEALSVEE